VLDVLEKGKKFAKYKLDVIAYADDILLGIDDNVNVNELISEIEDLVSLIGLTVNRDKCRCTKTQVVEFMGFRYSNNRHEEIALAPELLKRA